MDEASFLDHLILKMKFILLVFCVSYGERNFRGRAFHKQLLRDEDKIIKMSSGISLRKSYQGILSGQSSIEKRAWEMTWK